MSLFNFSFSAHEETEKENSLSHLREPEAHDRRLVDEDFGFRVDPVCLFIRFHFSVRKKKNDLYYGAASNCLECLLSFVSLE